MGHGTIVLPDPPQLFLLMKPTELLICFVKETFYFVLKITFTKAIHYNHGEMIVIVVPQ